MGDAPRAGGRSTLRSPEALASDLREVVIEAQKLSDSMRRHANAADAATTGEVCRTLDMIERVASAVEDLAVAVAAHTGHGGNWRHQR